MISSKTSQADLEAKKGLHFEIGMIISLILVFFIFQYKTPTRTLDRSFDFQDINIIEEEVINTIQPVTPPPPPQNQQFTLLTIVENESEEVADIDIRAEIDETTPIPVYIPILEKQEEEAEIIEKEIFTIVEEQPTFPGGDQARVEYFKNTLKYPTYAKELGIMGTVYIGFVVEPDGSISNVKLLRGIGGGCDEEAIRVVEAMPLWNPGKQRNKAVRVQFTLPVRFALI
jgi:protein TonB